VHDVFPYEREKRFLNRHGQGAAETQPPEHNEMTP
jgi:hypothetical protein